MDYTLSQIAAITGGTLHGDDRRMTAIATDSRNHIARPDETLFVALAGPSHDGHHYIPVAQEELIFFLRPGHLLPLAEPAPNVAALDDSRLKALSYPGMDCQYTLYSDDGIGKDYENPDNLTVIRTTADGRITYEGAVERTLLPLR